MNCSVLRRGLLQHTVYANPVAVSASFSKHELEHEEKQENAHLARWDGDSDTQESGVCALGGGCGHVPFSHLVLLRLPACSAWSGVCVRGPPHSPPLRSPSSV